MKRFVWIGLAALLLIIAAIFGPDAWGLYKLQHQVTAAERAYRADGGAWPHLSDTCTGCHGPQGHSRNQAYPSLAGQPAAYVTAQLQAFAAGTRANPTMGSLARSLSAADVRQLADYFAGQRPAANDTFTPDPGQRDRGRQLVVANGCAACHGETLMGQGAFPRLAGQGRDYLAAQLDAFASGARTEPTGTMYRLAAGLAPADRAAVASYLAGLAPASK